MLFSRNSSQKSQTKKVTSIICTVLLKHIPKHIVLITHFYCKTIEFMNNEFDQMSWKKYGKDTMITTKY